MSRLTISRQAVIRSRRAMLLALTMLAVTPTTRAQPSKVPWPAKPIRVVVPYPAGGNADLIARLLSNKLAARLDTTVIVENRPGASGMIGADSVAKATPDGYTLLFTVVSQLVVPPLGVKPPYDPFKDFRPLAGVSMNPLLIHFQSWAISGRIHVEI